MVAKIGVLCSGFWKAEVAGIGVWSRWPALAMNLITYSRSSWWEILVSGRVACFFASPSTNNWSRFQGEDDKLAEETSEAENLGYGRARED